MAELPAPLTHQPLPIIHINGFPGTGKLTVARELETLLHGPEHAKVVHNHLLINPADAVLHRTQPGYQALRKALRTVIFDTLAREPATHNCAYIFTDFQSTDAVGSAVCAEYTALATRRGCALMPIVLTCSEEANLTRLVAGDRAMHKKLTDVDLVKKFRGNTQVHQFEANPAMLEVDTTRKSPQQTAKLIYDHVVFHCPEVVKGIKVSD